MLLRRCPCGFNREIQVENYSKGFDVTVFAKTIGNFCNEDIVPKYAGQPQQLELDLLVSDNIDTSKCACGKKDIFRNLRHVLIFLICSGVKKVSVVGLRESARKTLFLDPLENTKY